jgi:peptide/nickel transport system ATP-binding protein
MTQPLGVVAKPDVLRVENLSIEHRTVHGALPLISDVSLRVGWKSVVGIIGESGAGKTVLAKALVNWITPPLAVSQGRIIYGDQDLLRLGDKAFNRLRGREIAYIGSDPTSALDPTLPVGRQIIEKLLAVRPDLSRSQARELVVETFDAVRIPSPRQRIDEYPFQFSGGMMQRALIVDALVSNPKLLIADNITQPLDVTVAAQILRLLRGLQERFDTSIVFVSSSLGTVADIADQLLVMRAGRIVEAQATTALIERPQHAYTQELIVQVPRIWSESGVTSERGAVGGNDVVLSVREVARTYSVRDLKTVFGKKHVQAVRGVSFDVRRGENFGLIGESGCGKSTLSRLLSCLEAPDAGEIRFDGVDLSGLGRRRLLDWRRRFQLLLQDPYNAIASHMAIGETIAEPLRVHRLARGVGLRERVSAVMAEVGLDPALYERLPQGLSAGQRQRVNIARALILEPELLIFDETLSALDQVEQAKLLCLFKEIQQRRGITCVYISHDLALVRKVCQRIAVMYLGKVVEIADNRQLFERPAHPYTRALLSAVPTLETRPFPGDVYLLEGEPPDPINIASGCSFRTRCPFALERCSREEPVLRGGETAGGRAACHRSVDELPEPGLPAAGGTTGLLATQLMEGGKS